MAPRTAKAKKTTEVSEAPKKGRGKAKATEEAEPEVDEQSIDDKAPADKKKRGKKAAGDANGQQEENGKEEAPPAKKGKKKADEPAADDVNEQSAEEEATTPVEQEEENVESNGDVKETQTAGRGRKKQGKKAAEKKAEPKPTRGRKAKQEAESDEAVKDEEVEEKPKPAPKGRGRKAQPKPEPENEQDKEDAPEPAARGRKKAPAKKEKTPESEEVEEEEKPEEEEEPEEPKKKETKGKRNQKKPAKDDETKDDDDESEAAVPAAKKRKVNKKEEKGKGDEKDDEEIEEEEEKPEPKPKGRRGKKAAEPSEAQESGDATAKRRRKPAEDKAPAEKKPPKNKAVTDYDSIDFSNTSKNKQGKDWNFKISSWNVDGIRAWMNKGGLDYLSYEKPDILCVQEVKCSDDKLPEEVKNLPGYHAYWLCSDKDGYAGVGIYTTQLAMNVQYGLQNEELDAEGRIITAEYEQFYLICTYVPNAGRKLITLPKRLQWNEEFRKYVKELDQKKPVIICGDMNVSHNEIDLANPKTNRKNAGFTDEERAGMSELLGDGFVDTFRHLYPDKTGAYTFWTYMMNSRAKNVGWRLDYFIVSERLLPSLCDNVIRDQVYGSDHCPISLFLHLSGADKPTE